MFARWRTLAAAAGAVCFPFALAYGSAPQTNAQYALPAICTAYQNPRADSQCPYLREYWHERYYRDSWDEPGQTTELLGDSIHSHDLLPPAESQPAITEPAPEPIWEEIAPANNGDEGLPTTGEAEANATHDSVTAYAPAARDILSDADQCPVGIDFDSSSVAIENTDFPSACPAGSAATLADLAEDYGFLAEPEYDQPTDSLGAAAPAPVFISNIAELDEQLSGQEQLDAINELSDGLDDSDRTDTGVADVSSASGPAAELVGVIEELCDFDNYDNADDTFWDAEFGDFGVPTPDSTIDRPTDAPRPTQGCFDEQTIIDGFDTFDDESDMDRAAPATKPVEVDVECLEYGLPDQPEVVEDAPCQLPKLFDIEPIDDDMQQDEPAEDHVPVDPIRQFHMFYPGCDWSRYLPTDVTQADRDFEERGVVAATPVVVHFPLHGAAWLSQAATSLVTWTGKLAEQAGLLLADFAAIDTIASGTGRPLE